MQKDQLKADMKEALKQGNQEVLGVIRMVLASISTKEQEKRYAMAKEKPEATEEQLAEAIKLSDDEVMGVITTEVKKRRDAIALYEEGGRPELAETEKKEIAILQKYLPEQLSPDELSELIKASITSTGATEMKDMGKIMADLAPKVKGRAENSEISRIAKELLSK